ncbi:MAG TPA: multicopper oxidase family protein [Henriciella marina]|nr:multicopper oxidase family protein [Henriciella marina]
MMAMNIAKLSRRGFLAGGGAVAVTGTAALFMQRGGSVMAGSAVRGPIDMRLLASPATVPLLGDAQGGVDVWAYNGEVAAPEIRIRQGERLRVTLDNGLAQETTIHWHGLRVPNAMDGVPHLTQDPVRPGQSFTYDFVPQDAGTFWYHPHHRSFEQVARGLYAPLIVEEREPIMVDRDITWMLDDWRIGADGQINDDFGNPSDAFMSGRVGNTMTINGRPPQPFVVRSGERIRLRLINAANARIFALDFSRLNPQIIALDGQPVAPHEVDGALHIAPGMRIDLILDPEGAPGSRVTIGDSFYEGLEFALTDVVYSDTPLRADPLTTPIALPPNPIPEPQTETSTRHEVVFGGGMMGPSATGKMDWTVNGVAASGHNLDPVLTLPRGESVILTLRNETAWWHPIHLHGHSFRVLSRNGKPTRYREWQDTVLTAPHEIVEVAFVADNPGDWMFHCHILEHQAAGMMATVRVT